MLLDSDLVYSAIGINFTILSRETSGAFHHYNSAKGFGAFGRLIVSVRLEGNPIGETKPFLAKGSFGLGLRGSGLINSDFLFRC